jgi:hypothetical protein
MLLSYEDQKKRFPEQIDTVNNSEPKTSINFLQKAISLQEERGNEYEGQGKQERSFNKISIAFNTITGKNITPAEVALLLQIVKDVRQFSQDRYHQDSIEDSVSYASLKAELLYEQYKDEIKT